jgi:hypothetical protein
MTDDTSGDQFWPDNLELGDRFEFDGDTYQVVGTGPGKATADRVGDDSITIELGRYAFTNAVYIEMETTMDQEAFAQSVSSAIEQSQNSE